MPRITKQQEIDKLKQENQELLSNYNKLFEENAELLQEYAELTQEYTKVHEEYKNLVDESKQEVLALQGGIKGLRDRLLIKEEANRNLEAYLEKEKNKSWWSKLFE
ncbi:MAG: hypothetical protein AABY22_03730 [Nanoarchaeota archaeon]